MTVVISPLSGRAYNRFDDRYWGAKLPLCFASSKRQLLSGAGTPGRYRE